MSVNRSFAHVADRSAAILILGSMPGVESLKQQQYYAHPRNAFWPIMGELCGFDPSLPYRERLERLIAHRIALWDVAHQCERPGSLDASIKTESVIANDFNALFQAHPHIRAIFFNGGKAAELYRRLVLPELAEPWRSLPRTTLPSTSPAHAAMSRQQKFDAWLQIRKALTTVAV